MPYVSLYRKYRPQNFEDVVGQEHVTTTLRNAIAAGRIANGYLFCGTRGTAKTTCARILAKALNCIGPDGTNVSPTVAPCNVCSACLAINTSSLVDVVEIDAASHGKVEDVRDLTANIKFPPMVGRYKVYIIDEAHQLSRDAMDAFLKTLEEPPDRVVFVLATTEPDKLPVTIASRCQVFEFRRGTMAEIESRLRYVLEHEGATAEDPALRLLARAADGSYRDSLTLLEQVLAYRRENISRKDVNLVLGMVDDEMADRAVALISDADQKGLLNFADEVLAAGKDVRHFLQGLSRRLRDLLVVRVGASASTLETDVDHDVLKEQAASFSSDALLQQLRILAAAEREAKTSTQHRLLLELCLLNLAEATSGPSVMREEAHVYKPERRPAYDAEPPAVRRPEPAVVQPVAVERDDTIAADEENPAEPERPPLEPGHVSLFEESAPAPANNQSSTEGEADVIDRLLALWPQAVNRMATKTPSGVPFIRDARPVALAGRTLTIEFTQQGHVDRMEKNLKARAIFEEIINKTLGVLPNTYQIRASLRRGGDSNGGLGQRPIDIPPDDGGLGIGSMDEPPDQISPLLDKVIAEFGGRLLDVDA